MSHELHQQNRRSWNHATRAHNAHKGDQAGFLRAGGSTLFPEELELLGDLHGKRLVHLQCNAGQDTLSLAARGAQVIGVDISDDAIEFARTLSRDSGIAATFERADVFDWLASSPAAQLDIAFSSYGALPWLSDLPTWARGVARVLASGGRLVVVEFHPLLNLFDDEGRITSQLAKGGKGGHITWDKGVGDYVAASEGALPAGEHVETQPFVNPEPCHEWEWSVADVVDAVARAGLRIQRVVEWPYSNGCKFFPNMVALDGKRWALAADAPKLPCMYGLVAERA